MVELRELLSRPDTRRQTEGLWDLVRCPATLTEAEGQSRRSDTEISPPHKVAHRLTGAIVAEMVESYRAGRSSNDLARAHDVSKQSVLRLLQKQGVERRRRGLSDDQVADAVRLYEAGLSVAAVAECVGAVPSTTYRTLQRAGVAFRPTGPRPGGAFDRRTTH